MVGSIRLTISAYLDLGNAECQSKATSPFNGKRGNGFTPINQPHIPPPESTPMNMTNSLQRHGVDETYQGRETVAVLRATTQRQENTSEQFHLSPSFEDEEDIYDTLDVEATHRQKRLCQHEISPCKSKFRAGPGPQQRLNFKVAKPAIRSTTGLLSPPHSAKVPSKQCFPEDSTTIPTAQDSESNLNIALSSATHNSSRTLSVASRSPTIALIDDPKNFREACDAFEKEHKLGQSDPKRLKRLRSPSPSDDEAETFGMRIQPPFDYELEEGYDVELARCVQAGGSWEIYVEGHRSAHAEEDEGDERLEVVGPEEDQGYQAMSRELFAYRLSRCA
jgi:hypothetical protein